MKKASLNIVLFYLSFLYATNSNDEINNRQGGESFSNATVIFSLPYTDSGTTTGYYNDIPAIESLADYNICNWQGMVVSEGPTIPGTVPGSNLTGLGPDVIYSIELVEDTNLRISLCGSDYDTNLGIFIETNNTYSPVTQVMGSDDYCGDQSEVMCTFPGGETYYIVVTGQDYGFGDYAHGSYTLNISIEDNYFGPYEVGTITEDDGLADGPDHCCGIAYYPLEAEGPLPTVVYIPGYFGTVAENENWGLFLASHGIVTMFVNATWPWYLNEGRSAALLDGVTTIQNENERADSPLFNKIDVNNINLAGFGNGGGGALLVGDLDSSIRSVIALGTYLDADNISQEIVDTEAPILFISSEYDFDVDNDIHTNVFYEYVSENTDKLLYEISGGVHTTFKDPNNNYAMGQKVLHWLEKYSFNDVTNCELLISPSNTASSFSTNIECETISSAPVIDDIADHQTNEDDPLTISISASSQTGSELTYMAESDTSALPVYMIGSSLAVGVQADWNGSANVKIVVTDENNLSDSTSFMITVNPVNDPPQDFGLYSPTIIDTFEVNTSSDATIPFLWENSYDNDSDVLYTLEVTLDYFGDSYTMKYEDLSNPSTNVSTYEYASLMTNQNILSWKLTYVIMATDGEYIVDSEVGEFILVNSTLNIDESLIPSDFKVYTNHPNPFNPTTNIRYDLPYNDFITIQIFDMMGRLVKTLINSSQTAGSKSIQWNATNNQGEVVSAGMYICIIQAGEIRKTIKMVLLK